MSLEHSPADMGRAAAVLARGEVIVYPTETFYGLGARSLSPAAVAAVARLKGRDAGKPIALVASDEAMVARVVRHVPAPAARLMARFWPGPLTLVLPARDGLPPELTAGTGVVGVRISSHPVARALADALGEPLTATSANPGGAAPACDVASAHAYFGPAVAAYVDGGTLAGGLGSTVLLVGDDSARLVRGGALPVELLRDALGNTPILV